MKIEKLIARARCPVCGNRIIHHDPEKHKCIDEVKEVYECECPQCGAAGHVMWNEVRNRPLYCCWPKPEDNQNIMMGGEELP